ncbi:MULTISPECIES: 4Fe-4S dicluster domain-containing protein [Romboutsia]|jgi:Pyruvate/2-oxoacid:ferredoxin oxidoreductase delta subunit|uniref:4Fe-4S dicluster domain-containing protein n=1 Tax=Romboutsia TaxID=1501226 RepID=UPI00216D380C|nr:MULTISPECIES: 4Fe-4S dicluster domain-containing protein [Romboutsia]MCI9060931.1 4Fe-4S dicluster domain-containing protein [Romboutsia sp.]
MSHITAKNAYKSLEERINKFPQRAPPSKTLYQILSILFTEEEARLVAKLPIKAFRVKTAANIWNVSQSEAYKILDNLAKKALILDIEDDKGKKYILPPPMAGFFEFSMMRTRHDIDQKLLAELYYQYINEEEDFIKELFYSTDTKLGRVYVQEEVLTNENEVTILDYERATHIIEESKHIGISMCYCRHRMSHVGKACDAPMDICMTFNNTANSLINNNFARRVDASECKELLHQAYENNLVQCGENVRSGVTFICNCCGCCCEALVAAKRFGNMNPVQTTSFIPQINYDSCINCGKCVKICPIDAISKSIENNKEVVKIDEDRCLGCGVCVRNCHKKSITLRKRKEKIITPANSVHRAVLMAIEKGQLQNLIFDNEALASHRAMGAILSSILNLEPAKRALANEQLKSTYLDRLLSIKKPERKKSN